MEFWLENQGQSQLYSRFGTLPGRNCAHSYHDQHQATYNTMYYGEQQDQGRESSEWTGSGARAGGALQEYTNWTEPELPSSSSVHFPFILHRHGQRHQDLGEYRQHNHRDREWASHGAVRDYDRGFLRDTWQKRWDQSHPSTYNRDVSAKRNDSSYRELEAWAARYSHSLPRRRRLEAELREAVRGLSESGRAPEREKLVTNPRAQLQHSQLNPNRRASGLWDKAEPPAMDTNHMKEKIEYQSRVFGRPPGYIGPPPYNKPLKSPPVIYQPDDGWQQVGKKQADWSQPTLRKQDVLVDLQTKRKVEKDESKTCPKLEELESSKHEGDCLQAACPIEAQKPEGVAEEPQTVQKSNMETEEICKVIEGRKFRLKKKTGGMTIFCLVSRIASPSETTCLPVCTSQTSFQNTETDRPDNNQVNKIADDVDFSSQTLKEQKDKKTIGCREKVMPEDDLPNTANSVPQSVQPVLTRYPLWREPSSSSKAESESSNTNGERKGSILNQDEGGDVSNQSTDNEKKNLDIMEKAEDMRGLLVIDTSCVVVKVKLIPSPKKEQVHYLGSTENGESSSSESNSLLCQDVTTEPSNEALKGNEDPEAHLDPTLLEKGVHKESCVSLSSVQQSLFSDRETLEQRAERILGIPLHDAIVEQQTESEEPLIDLLKEENEEDEQPPSELTFEDTADHVEVLLAEKNEDGIRKQVTNKDFAEPQLQATNMTEDDNTESRLQTGNTSTPTDLKNDSTSGSTCGGSKNEKRLVDLNNSTSLSLNASGSSIQEGLDCQLDAQNTDVDPHPDESLPPVQPPPLFPESPDSPLSSTLSEDHLPSPPPLEEMLLAADVECGAEPKDGEGETSHSADSGVNDESLVTETKEVLPHQHSECHQVDDAPSITEKQQTDEADSSRAETKNEDLNLLTQQLRCAQPEGVTCATEKDLLVVNENLSDPTVQAGEENEVNARTCETEDYRFLPKSDLEEDVLCRKERDVTPEQSQINPGLITSLLKQTRSNERDTCTQLKTDTLQNLELQGKGPIYSPPSSSGSEDLISDFSSLPQEPDRDYNPHLEISPQNVDIAAAPDVENSSSRFYLGSCEKSSQLSTFLPQEEDVFPKFCPSAAHKKGSQYPKSLLDVVSRIRKHTAPDSESEDEEVSEQWDPSCLDVIVDIQSEENLSDELQVVLTDSAETGQGDQDDKEPEGHAEEDTGCCSTSRHVSEDPVTVAGGETRLSGEADKEKEESDTEEGEQRCSGEENGETQSKESEEEEEDLNINGSSEESPVEVDQDASDLLN